MSDLVYLSGNIINLFNNITSTLGVAEIPMMEISTVIEMAQYTIKNHLQFELEDRQIKALDVFNKEFIVDSQQHNYILTCINDILVAKKKYPDIPIENILLKTKKRFCVVYFPLIPQWNDNSPKIVDIPEDIFKFLIINNYDEELIRNIVNDHFKIEYNYVEIFRKTLEIGRSFKEKAEILGAHTTNIFEYLEEKYNKIPSHLVVKEFTDKFGLDKKHTVDNYCKELNINIKTIMYRTAYLGMSFDDAIDLGAKETEKYKIGYSNISSRNNFTKEIFYTVAREYIQEKGVSK